MEEILKEFNELKKEQEKLVSKIRGKAKIAFNRINKSIFKTSNKVVRYKFQAFTPYFNDGEECTYTSLLGEPKIYISHPEKEEIEIEIWSYKNTNEEKLERIKNELYSKRHGTIKPLEYDENLNKAILMILNLDDIFSAEDIKFIFGDHVEVECSKDEISTSYYEHD